MSTMTISELYEWHIKPLSFLNRLGLVDVVTHLPSETSPSPQHDIMELHGLGAEIWKGIDAQEYVNQLREEWDRMTAQLDLSSHSSHQKETEAKLVADWLAASTPSLQEIWDNEEDAIYDHLVHTSD